jgi:hypothetical protein
VTRLWLAFIATCVAPAAHAQTGVPAVDSAAVARAEWREASRASTPAAALAHVTHAARAWPGQPAYWSAMAMIAAQVSDTAHLLESLARLGGLGAGAEVITDTAVVRMSTVPGVADAVRRIRNATSDVVAGRVFRTSADSTVFAEGVDADSASGRIYVASIRHHTCTR